MSNNHCDFVGIEVAYDLIDKLRVTKGDFARLCDVSHNTLNRWENKGRMPLFRLSNLREELFKLYKKEFDDKCKILGM